MQRLERWMHASVKQTLERFLVEGQLEQVLPGQWAVLLRELSVLLQHPLQLRHVELGHRGRAHRLARLLELRSVVLIDRVLNDLGLRLGRG